MTIGADGTGAGEERMRYIGRETDLLQGVGRTVQAGQELEWTGTGRACQAWAGRDVKGCSGTRRADAGKGRCGAGMKPEAVGRR